MIEEQLCPYCDELINIEYTDDFYFAGEGEVFGECICHKCGKTIALDYETTKVIHARRIE